MEHEGCTGGWGGGSCRSQGAIDALEAVIGGENECLVPGGSPYIASLVTKHIAAQLSTPITNIMSSKLDKVQVGLPRIRPQRPDNLIITACAFSVAAALWTYQLTQRGRNNSSDVLVLRARAITAGLAALVLASLGAALDGGDTQLWIAAATTMFTALVTLARAATYNMYAR